MQVSEERLWGGLTERVMVASGASYVVSPVALGPIAADPSRRTSPLSASYLIALAARIVREVSGLMRRAREAGKELATLSIDTEVRFKSAADRAAFAKELTAAVTTLVARYHDATTPGGRPHRLVVVAHPLPSTVSGPRSMVADKNRQPKVDCEIKEACMPVKVDASGRRSVQAEAEVPGTPEEVWQAIATGPGISSWFVPTEIQANKDGIPEKLICHFGPVRAWTRFRK